ncbi:DegT/DnrJ/EryC1/StrS family aminotransferase [Nitrosopumilus sp.]|nr:DegT/DnrJ/EryC1/StrS family aminotransferase [Nitrosopumilus sp.]MDC0639303.1 DegT/DnrJ/EryC1/StrS family aminotransferase [Nitrosopumilus sp.]|tara:strand:- start:680 stop:1837 length:1158 start_codon:yes stop_codon:yes gene_type:complete
MSKKEINDWKIPLYKIYTDDEDVQLITKIVRRGSNWAIGPEIEEFEESIKNYVGSDYCLTLNSGTSALHASFLAYGFGTGDEIIVPSFTFVSTVNATRFVNASPIFSDIEEKTFGLDPKSIKSKITSSTKAVVPMDYGGSSCDINSIKKITNENNLKLIEDAAEGLGSSINGKKVGSLSDLAIFSFCGNKVLTTGEGGAIVTNSKEVYNKIKSIRSHGRLENISYFNNPSDAEYLGVGYNWRMSSITAALGISQISKLDKLIKMRQENACFISQQISKHKQIQVPQNPENIYQMYSILLENNKLRNALQKFLLEKKIFCKIYFQPIHLMDYYVRHFKDEKISLPMTESVSKRILTLPLYPNMNNEEKQYLVDSINEFFENSSKFL